ncbi:MAG: DUF4197 domain-containing protein [Bacteroidia bacterium]|jgi:hypothetical protein|nr:DUF4197 domain-containing protein [Bacteroidia bacterium]
MKKFLLLALLLSSLFSKAQVNINNILNSVNSTLGNGLSNADITKGLKEALNVGTKNATGKASKLDGYYKNSLIKIPFPSEAKDMRSTLMKMGMKKQVDDFEKQLNRAAEDAATKAAPIFLAAITKMTINDGLTILRGKDDEATQYLKRSTSAELSKQFRPIIAASLKKVQITKYWNPLFTTYNKVPFVKRVNPNLDDYVTQRAIEGLFKLVAQEETKIRKDPAARISDILKKVFGGGK